VHKEEPICGEYCVKHVLKEVEEIQHKIRHMWSEIHFMLSEHGVRAFLKFTECFNAMMEILDELHEHMRGTLNRNPAVPPHAHQSQAGSTEHVEVKMLLQNACAELKHEFEEIVGAAAEFKLIPTSATSLLKLK
jgi:hypothetical protein